METIDTGTQELRRAVESMLPLLDDHPDRDGLRETPERVARALLELTSGGHQDPAVILGKTFEESSDELVLVRDVPFVSLCEHHLMPFTGHATVGYVPHGNRVVGLSKIPRLVKCFASRLQIQERLTAQVADALATHVEAAGVGVIMTAQHSCMALRGVRSEGEMVTSCLLGCMRTGAARHEFLMLAHKKSPAT